MQTASKTNKQQIYSWARKPPKNQQAKKHRTCFQASGPTQEISGNPDYDDEQM